MQALATDSTSHKPDGRWAFDEHVTACFEDMLARSIPQYPVMRGLVTDLASRYRTKGTAIVDLGCSRGDALAPLVDRFGAANHFVGIEVSPPMLAAARERFAGYIDNGVVSIENRDLRFDYPDAPASVTLSVLTLQFIPIEYRQAILAHAYEQTLPGGAFLLVEKVLGSTARIDATFVDRYLAMKRENGYGEEEITRKRYSLEGVLVPVTADWNVELLKSAGFRHVDCFFRWANFAGWLAVRE